MQVELEISTMDRKTTNMEKYRFNPRLSLNSPSHVKKQKEIKEQEEMEVEIELS